MIPTKTYPSKPSLCFSISQSPSLPQALAPSLSLCPPHASFPYSPVFDSNESSTLSSSSPSFALLLSPLPASAVGGPSERIHCSKAYSTCTSSPDHLLGAYGLIALFLNSLRKHRVKCIPLDSTLSPVSFVPSW